MEDLGTVILILHTVELYCSNIPNLLARHEDQLANYEASIQNILSTQATLSTNIANIESRFSSSTVNAVVPNQASPPSGRIAQAETLELLRRSHNILLKGIVEGNNDESIVTDIISHVEPTANAHRVSITRLGTATSRPRPIRVAFSSPVLAESILRKKQTIPSHPSLNTVRILDDKTPLQVQQLCDLRDELKHRQDAGESNIIIKCVRGIPSIVSLAVQDPSSSKN
nr:unnamed protein product [Callosobruchus analis]